MALGTFHIIAAVSIAAAVALFVLMMVHGRDK